MKKVSALLSFVLIFSAFAAEKVIYSETFNHPDGTPIEKLGFSNRALPERSTYRIADGKLHIKISDNPYQDGYIEIPVPVVRKGRLDFDIVLPGGNGPSITVDLYNIGTFFHDYCKDWRYYFPEPTKKRMPDFNVEPVGHKAICRVVTGKTIHCRVLFDTDRDTVEFFVNDMEIPGVINGDAAVLGHAEYRGGYLRIGSMGLSSNARGEYIIDNIELYEITDDRENKDKNRNMLLIFNGFGASYYNVAGALTAEEAARARYFTVITAQANDGVKNRLRFDRMPSSQLFAAAKTIVFADVNCEPALMPEFLHHQVLDAVRDGAELVILGGLFSLERGGMRDSVFEPHLPVAFTDTFFLKAGKFNVPDLGTVKYVHDVTLSDGAKALVKDGETVLVAEKAYGKGVIRVYTGTPTGASSDEISKGAKSGKFIRKMLKL